MRGAGVRRRWAPRVVVAAFLAVPMLLALGGTSKASELDPIVETVADTVDPIVETVTDTVDPIVETVADTVDPIVETVTDTVDPIVETVIDTVDPVVDPVRVVLPRTKGIVGRTDVDPLVPLPWLPASRVIVPNPGSVVGLAAGPDGEGTTAFDRHGEVGGAFSWSRYPTTIAPSSGASGMQRADVPAGRGLAGSPIAPLGSTGADSSLTLLVLLAALATSVRAFKPSILSSIVPRTVPMNGAALALSVERPG